MGQDLDEQPWILRTMLRAMAEDQAGFRARAFTIMPRVFFAMLPVFAAIVALFYRRRHFPAAFGGGWAITTVKAAGIGCVYLIASLPALFIVLLWGSLV